MVSGLVDVANTHETVPLALVVEVATVDDAKLSTATISLLLGSRRTTDFIKFVLDVLNVSLILLSCASPALFAVSVIEPICWKLVGGAPVTGVAATASTVLKVVWGLPEAFERLTLAVLFDVAPRATTFAVDEVPLEGVPAVFTAVVTVPNVKTEAEAFIAADPADVRETVAALEVAAPEARPSCVELPFARTAISVAICASCTGVEDPEARLTVPYPEVMPLAVTLTE